MITFRILLNLLPNYYEKPRSPADAGAGGVEIIERSELTSPPFRAFNPPPVRGGSPPLDINSATDRLTVVANDTLAF